jgi:hypothetical protein
MIERCMAVRNGALTSRASASPGLIIASHQKLGRVQSIECGFFRKAFSQRATGSAGRAGASLVSFAARCVRIDGFFWVCQSADVGDDTAKAAASTLPNIYLDMRTIYTKTPGDTLSIGFSNPSSSAVATLQSLAPLANSPALPARPPLSAQSAAVDFPLTVDLSDRVSVYGGFSGIADRHVGLVDVRGQQLERRISG